MNHPSVESVAAVRSAVQQSRPSTIAISSSVNPYNPYTSAPMSWQGADPTNSFSHCNQLHQTGSFC